MRWKEAKDAVCSLFMSNKDNLSVFFEFHSPHHKDWRLGSQQVRQNCIGFHGRCKTQRGYLRRKPKICSPANPGSSLHLTTTSRNSSCSLSLSLSCIQHNHIVCVARLIIGLFTCALGWRRKANNPKQSYMYYNNVWYDTFMIRFFLSRISHDCMQSSRLHAVCWYILCKYQFHRKIPSRKSDTTNTTGSQYHFCAFHCLPSWNSNTICTIPRTRWEDLEQIVGWWVFLEGHNKNVFASL